MDAVAKKDVIEEAAEWALSHPPAPISKREVPKTNRCGAPEAPDPVDFFEHDQHEKLIFTLWLFNIAMENSPFIHGLPGFTY